MLLEEPKRKKLGSDWIPPADAFWRPPGKQLAAAFEPLRVAMQKTVWPKPVLDRVGAAMQRWRGAGRCDGLGHVELVRQLRWKDRPVLGPKDPKGRARPRPRYEHAVIEVAALVRRRGPELRREVRSDAPPGPTMQQELALAQKQLQEAATSLNAARLECDRTNNKHRKLKARVEMGRAKVKKHKKEVKQAAAAKVKAAKAAAKQKFEQRLDKAVEKKVAAKVLDKDERIQELTRQRAKARRRARDKEDDAKESGKRLKRARKAERELKAIKRKRQDETAPELQSESEAASESGAGCESEEEELSPKAKRGRRDERGRFAAMPWQARPLVWAQLARRTPPSAVNANITDVLEAFASEQVVPLPCEREVQRMRGELTLGGECLAAFRVALARRIISFGFDESTKFGIGLLSTNTQIEPHDAPGSSVDVVMRGVTVSASGKAEHLAAAIEKDIFSHARTLLTGWKAQHEKMFGAGSWAAAGAPEPESIGLHRLSKHAVLVSDTCNGARATKRLVAEHAERAGREKLGITPEAWEAMGEAERESVCKVGCPPPPPLLCRARRAIGLGVLKHA